MIRLFLTLMVLTIHLSAMTGLDVMTLVKKESQKKSTRKVVVHMTIYDDQNRERVRFFNYWTKYKQDREDSLIKFFRPKNVKGTSLLTNSNKDADSKSQWIYLPAFKSVKRLSSSDKNKSFMGSDFTYSDIAGRKLSQDMHQLIKDTDRFYYIESVPNHLEDSIYSKIRYVVSKKYNVINKAIFYDLYGQKLKTLSNSKVSIVNDVNVVMYSEMINHQTNGRTILNVNSIDIGITIKDELLSIKGLKSQ